MSNGNESSQVTLAQAVKNLRDNLPALLEMEEINARITRRKFVALQAQGFSEQQALELCKRA
jgi:hypothetical protein